MQDLTQVVAHYLKDYPVVSGAMSLWGLAIISYIARDIPKRIYVFAAKHMTTTLILTSQHRSFFNFLKWFEKKGLAKKIRINKINNGRWGCDDGVKSLGYGSHLLYIENKFVLVNASAKETLGTDDKESITLTVFGRSHSFFDKLFCLIKEEDKQDRDKLKMEIYLGEAWRPCQDQPKRSLDTVFIRETDKAFIIEKIQEFLKNEKWYIGRGIPYQIGFLFYGPPGTGKTSLIKALGSHLNKKLCVIPARSLAFIESALSGFESSSFLVIEDIDANTAVHSRDSEGGPPLNAPTNPKSMVVTAKAPPIAPISAGEASDFIKMSMSDILNGIDGLRGIHGRILFATTNHIEKLDPALLRSGRLDHKIELGYADEGILKQFFNAFYPGFVFAPKGKLKEGLVAAEIQKQMISSPPEEALRFFYEGT